MTRSAALIAGQAKELPRPADETWQQAILLPEVLAASCERFALVKLSHPGHDHRNLPRALAEFGLLV